MTLEKILEYITIIENNSYAEPILPFGIIISLVFFLVAYLLYDYGKPKKRTNKPNPMKISTYFMAFFGAVTIISTALLSTQKINTNINLYICANDVSVEDISEYFEITDPTIIDDLYYMSIKPKLRYHVQACKLLLPSKIP